MVTFLFIIPLMVFIMVVLPLFIVPKYFHGTKLYYWLFEDEMEPTEEYDFAEEDINYFEPNKEYEPFY